MDLETIRNMPALWVAAHPFLTAMLSLFVGLVIGAVIFRTKKKK